MLDNYPQEEQFDWREEYKVRHTCGKNVRRFIASMSPQYFLRDEVRWKTLFSHSNSPTANGIDHLFSFPEKPLVGNICGPSTLFSWKKKSHGHVKSRNCIILELTKVKQWSQKISKLFSITCSNINYNCLCTAYITQVSKEAFGELNIILGDQRHGAEFLIDELLGLIHDGYE